jgi:protein FrlC
MSEHRGIPLLSAMNCAYRFFGLESFFVGARDAGYEACELWTGPMHYFVDYRGHDSLAEVQALERHYGVRVIGVCPEQTNPKPCNVASRDHRMKERTCSYFRNVIDVACELGAHQVVATSGWGYLDEPREDAWRRSAAMLHRIGSYAERRGMLVAVEALQASESNLARTTTDLARLLEEASSPALKVCLDTGAMWAAGQTIDDYFDAFGADVVHVHFVDCADTTHVAWGDGQRDMASDLARFRERGYEGYLSVETVDPRYLGDPAAADARAMSLYQRAVKELLP